MMGCFLPCLGASKRHCKSPQKSHNKVPSGDQKHVIYETLQHIKSTNQLVENNIEPISDSKDRNEEKLDGNVKKKVSFDLNVKTHEQFSTQNNKNCLVEFEIEKERENKEETQTESQTQSDSSSVSSLFSYPPSHIYHICISNDDESEDTYLVETDSVHNNDFTLVVQEESSESLFSLSIDSRKQVSASKMDEKEVNSPITIGLNLIASDQTKFVDSVLNPIENLTQWKEVKARRSTPLKKYQEKENINLEQEMSIPFSEEPIFKPRIDRPKREAGEIAIDTSLSSWLVESEITHITRNSLKSVGNSAEKMSSWRSCEGGRPVLGALTVEEIKQLCVFSSPRRSLNRSPEEMPITGTVGSYWNCIGRV